MGYPLLVTADYHAVPSRHWERRYLLVHDLGDIYSARVCPCCRLPIAAHIWFLLVDDGTVSDCSEVAS